MANYRIKLVYPSGESVLTEVKPNGLITPHFTWAEECNPSCSEITKLVLDLDKGMQHAVIREDFRNWYYSKYRTGLKCNSCYREKKFNTAVGGSATSLHLTAQASDLMTGEVNNLKWNAIVEYCKTLMDKYNTVIELGRYSNRIHIGTGVTYTKSLYTYDKR